MDHGQQLDELRKKYCKRKITVNRKLERTNKDAQMFFNKIIDDLEKELTVPNYLKEDFLRQMVTKPVFHKIERILPLIKQVDETEDELSEGESKAKAPSFATQYSSSKKLESIEALVGTPSTSTHVETIPESQVTVSQELQRELVHEEPTEIPKLPERASKVGKFDVKIGESEVAVEQKKASPPSSGLDSILLELLNYRPKTKMTVYWNFFKKTPEKAAIWRRVTQLKKPKTTQQRADALASKISRNFVKWAHESDMDPAITEDEILNLFSPAKDWNKMNVRHEEVYGVPGQVGWYLGLKRRTNQNILAGQIIADKKAWETVGQANVAFGKSLPHNLYKGKSINDSFKKWLSTDFPRDLETMETVFADIKDLKITQKYAKFIQERPYIKPPTYLVESGLISYPDRPSGYKVQRGKRKLTKKESIYTLIEATKIEALRYDESKLPVLEETTY